MKNRTMTLLVVMLLAAAMTVLAQPGFRGPGAGKRLADRGFFAGTDCLPPRILLHAKEKIGLSQEQEKRIGELVEAHAAWAIKFGAEMRVKALKLRSRLDEIGMAEAEKMIREQADMRAEMQIARLRLQKEVQALLTPEQAARVAAMKKELPLRERRERRGLRQGRGDRSE